MKLRALAAYLNQRFPVVNMALFAILFTTVFTVATTTANHDLIFTWPEYTGMAAVISFFFRLRVFDEIKDYSLDAINHPYRVLQSGQITLKQLTYLAAVGSILEAAWSLVMGWQTLICWLLAVSYSLLMRYEFFVSDFLKKRLVLYAISHMLIMPLVILWVWSAYAPGQYSSIFLLLLFLLSLLGGFSFEISRKIHAPAAEKKLIDSYSKSIGYAGSIFTVLLILLTGIAVQFYLFQQLEARRWPYVLLALLFTFTAAFYLKALRVPDEKLLKLASLLVSLFMLFSYVSVILEILLRQ